MKALEELSDLIYRKSEQQQTFAHPHSEEISRLRLRKLSELLAAEEITSQEPEKMKNTENDQDANEDEEDTDQENPDDVETTERLQEKLPTTEDTRSQSSLENKESKSNQRNKIELPIHMPPIQPFTLQPILSNQLNKQVHARQFTRAMPSVTDFGKKKIRFCEQQNILPTPRISPCMDTARLCGLRGETSSLLTHRRKQFPVILGMSFKNAAHIRLVHLLKI